MAKHNLFSLLLLFCYHLEFKESTANKRASQRGKAKGQLRSLHCDQDDLDISNYEYGTMKDDSVMEGTQNK